MAGDAAPGLSLNAEICMTTGFCMQVIVAEFPQFAIGPGVIAPLKFSIVPNDILSGQRVQVRAFIAHSDTGLVEICVATDLSII